MTSKFLFKMSNRCLFNKYLYFSNIHRSLCSVAQDVKLSKKTDNVVVKSFDDIPGPKPASIFGFFWHVLPKVGRYYGLKTHEQHIKLNEEFGDIVRLRQLKYRNDLVLVYDAKDIETVFRNDGPWPLRDVLPSIKYYRETLRKDEFQDYGGVFTSEGKDWQNARSIQNSLLMQPRVVKQYAEKMAIIAQDFVEKINYLSSKNSLNEMPENFTDEINKWALESVGFLALEQRFGTFSSNLDSKSDTQQFISDIQNFFDFLYYLDVLPSLSKYFSTPQWKRYIETCDRITKFLIKCIEKAKSQIAKDNSEKDPHHMSIVEKLIKAGHEKYLLSNTMDILVGGFDTTSKTVSGILYNLSTNPDVQEKLRKEIDSVLPAKDTPITADKLESMPYLRATIKESLRLIPITSGLSRKNRNDLILSGYHIPAGTDIVLQQIPLFWNDKYFPNAKEFLPERWIRKGKNIDINPWVYLPFGFGPRSCVGRRIAQLEMEILVAKILKNFRIEWHHKPVEFDMKLFFYITSPLKFRMVPV